MKLPSISCLFATATASPCALARLAEENQRGLGSESNRNRDVCILGAGAAGVSAAYFLEERGYSVSVFEKLDRVGGKCFSPALGPEGQRIDLGATLMTGDYLITRDFVAEFKLKLLPPATPFATDFASQSIFPRDSSSDALLETAVNSYIALINTKFPELLNTPGFDTASMTAATLEELTMPFSAWLAMYGLQGLVPFFTIPIAYFGYGLLTDIPTMYAIKYANELSTRSLLAYGVLGEDSPPDLMAKIDGGFESLIEAIASSLEDVHLSADVIGVKRPKGDSPSNRPSILKYKDENGKSHTFKCRDVISAFPQKSSLMHFMGLDDREEAIFDKPFTQNYFTSSAKGQRTTGGEELDIGTYYDVNFFSTQQWDGNAVMIVKAFEEVDYFTVFQYAMPDDTQTDEEICDLLPDDLASYGVSKDDIEHFNRWVYFPAVSPEDIMNGFYDDLNELQGYRNTYYTGGLLNFELVENVMAYSKYLVETHFPDKTA